MDPQQYLEQLRARTRRKPEPKPVGGLLLIMRKARGRNGSQRLSRFRDAWNVAAEKLLGPAAAQATEVIGHAKGELKISCTSHPLAQELSQFRSAELLAELNRELDGKDRLSKLLIRATGAGRRKSLRN